MSVRVDPREERRALLSLLSDGKHPIELRYRVAANDWRKVWADTPEQADEIAATLTRRFDVFVGLLPRLGRTDDDQRRYAPSRVLWADCDSERASRKLDLFEPSPSAIVRSGGLDGSTPKRHAYWALAEPLPVDDVRRHALRLAHHLEGDTGSCDAGRVLRVPGSHSHKTGRVARLEAFTGETYSLDEITGELLDAPTYRSTSIVREGDCPLVPIGERHNALVGFLGLLRSMGFGEEALVAFVDPFLDHAVEIDEARCPLDREHARATARDIARRYSAHRTNGDRL